MSPRFQRPAGQRTDAPGNESVEFRGGRVERDCRTGAERQLFGAVEGKRHEMSVLHGGGRMVTVAGVMFAFCPFDTKQHGGEPPRKTKHSC